MLLKNRTKNCGERRDRLQETGQDWKNRKNSWWDSPPISVTWIWCHMFPFTTDDVCEITRLCHYCQWIMTNSSWFCLELRWSVFMPLCHCIFQKLLVETDTFFVYSRLPSWHSCTHTSVNITMIKHCKKKNPVKFTFKPAAVVAINSI